MSGVGGVLLATLGVLGALRLRAAPEPTSAPPPAPARVEAPAAQAPSAGFLGVIISEEALDLAPSIEGRLEEVRVQVGDHVRRGEVLATLEMRALQQERAMAEAELQSARAELRIAELALAEAEDRLRRREDPKQLSVGALSQEELIRAQYEQRMAAAKHEGARARVTEREARVVQLQQRLAESSLRAPFDGLVASRALNPGALVRPGQAVLHLLREGPQQVRFAVPQEEASAVRVELPVRVRVQEGGAVLSGRVSHVAPEVDVASRMVFAMARLETADPSHPLPTGTVARVEVSSDATPDGNGMMSKRKSDEH
ncbi:efflux RND transporter periplasmic adaptor subunit [Archangium lansingense]|uniref:Efflux RND transporter periplasmic adaptor subunit n=1 Tax=Archangium lansingense TaxID=2995310 RepID=A0ABT4A7Z9_9BACT|nr:efflux RND transporter periplasmic adaptor subunit [Archangium lansinium]MCY1077791.1 efflux RND transporter periplasmic adaptor subunit [Archangium lansinium]